MTSASYPVRLATLAQGKLPSAAELAAIHAVVCRARRQALCCSTCNELNERAARAERLAILLAEVA
jgi:hypothetical protein